MPQTSLCVVIFCSVRTLHIHNDGLKLGRDIKINFNAWIDCAMFTKFVVVITCMCVQYPMPYSTHITHTFDCECITSFFWNSPSRNYWMTNIRNRQKCAPLLLSCSYANSVRAFCRRYTLIHHSIGHCTCVLRARAFCRTLFPLQ